MKRIITVSVSASEIATLVTDKVLDHYIGIGADVELVNTERNGLEQLVRLKVPVDIDFESLPKPTPEDAK